MRNVQLGHKESIKVYVELDTGRILGFSPELCAPLFPPGVKYREHVCLHSWEIENWIEKYRRQQEIDAEVATHRQIEKESVFRKSLRAAIRARSSHVNQFNRDLNEAFIKLMDNRYDRMMEAKAKPQVHGMAEATEATKQSVDLALESPMFRNPLDLRGAAGGAVSAIEKIEHDRRN